MRIARLIETMVIAITIFSLVSCSKPVMLSPKDTVQRYMNELEIIKDPNYYKEFKKDAPERDSTKIDRYTMAVKATEDLVWTEPGRINATRKKTLMLAPLMVLKYKGFDITDVKEEKDVAFVTAVLNKLGVAGKNPDEFLPFVQGEDYMPVTFELIKTNEGWKIKNIEGVFNKQGL
ncbi:MAG: hypothetical protein JW800_02105 [Candidatus Omnitrophica bacterium]|nr:hypothetical protein [Candidatus Omnitrophota bacterium]